MGRNHRLGYDAEHAVEVMWGQRGRPVYRPRAGAAKDVGDLVGLPIVQSVKNWNHLALAEWIDDMETQMDNSGLYTGVVWHKRRGKASPMDWYVTTTGACAVTLLEAYCDAVTIR
jgi:hypothetical protein